MRGICACLEQIAMQGKGGEQLVNNVQIGKESHFDETKG